jgi:predicted N-acyltransferase
MTSALTLHDDPTTLDAATWDALLAASPNPTPFLRHAFLAALHRSGSAVTRTGWQPVFLTLTAEDGTLDAAAALYLKSHSYGEYDFLCSVDTPVQVERHCATPYPHPSHFRAKSPSRWKNFATRGAAPGA